MKKPSNDKEHEFGNFYNKDVENLEKKSYILDSLKLIQYLFIES